MDRTQYQPKAPFEVVGFKGGYMSWFAAVKIGKARHAAVLDANQVMIWSPTESALSCAAKSAANR